MIKRSPGRSGITILILVYLLLGQAFAASVPPWEAPDEPWHLVYSEALAAGRLPTEAETYEHHHPPLYYLWPAMTLRAAGIDVVPRSIDNYRYPFAAAAYLHPDDEAAQAPMRLLRTLSGILGTLVIALTWSATRVAVRNSRKRDRIAFLAASIVAVLPQFSFIAHSISNDTLATVWGAWLTYWGLRWIRWASLSDAKGPEAPGPGHRRDGALIAVALGLGAGLGLLTKLNLLALWPAVAIAWGIGALVMLRPRGRLRSTGSDADPASAVQRWTALAPAFVIIPLLSLALVAGAASIWPSIGANLSSTLLDRGAAREELSGAAYLFDQSKRMIDSLWGRYGWFNLRPPSLQRQWMNLVALLSVLGLPFAFRRSDSVGRASLVYALAICALAFGAGLRNVMVDPQPQARLVFPALPAFALLLARGAHALPVLPKRWRSGFGVGSGEGGRWPSIVGSVLTLSLIGTSLYASQRLLPEAYAPSRMAPPMIDTRMLPPSWKIAAQLDEEADDAAQSFVAREAGLRAIEVPVIVASGEGTLVARLFRGGHDDLEPGRTPLAETVTPLSRLGRPDVDVEVLGPLADTSWVRVEHEALADSAGQTFTLRLQIEGEGRAWLWGARSGSDYETGKLVVNGEEETDLVFSTLR